MKYNHSLGMFVKADIPGNVEGKTESGRFVLGSDPEKYAQGFTQDDHDNAKAIHTQKVTDYQSKIRSTMLKPGAFDHAKLMKLTSKTNKHKDLADWHSNASSEGEAETTIIPNPEGSDVEKCQTGTVQKSQKESINADVNEKTELNVVRNTIEEALAKGGIEAPKWEIKVKGRGYETATVGEDNIYKAESGSYHAAELEDLRLVEDQIIKGGPGSGQKGHQTTKEFSPRVPHPRKPYSGEEQHKFKDVAKQKKPQQKQTVISSIADFQDSDFYNAGEMHYSAPENMRKFHDMLRANPNMVAGHFEYDIQSDKILAVSDKAKAFHNKLKEERVKTDG